jgi:hypothetical protein
MKAARGPGYSPLLVYMGNFVVSIAACLKASASPPRAVACFAGDKHCALMVATLGNDAICTTLGPFFMLCQLLER